MQVCMYACKYVCMYVCESVHMDGTILTAVTVGWCIQRMYVCVCMRVSVCVCVGNINNIILLELKTCQLSMC